MISQEDMKCAFYLFRLPDVWCPFFAVGLPVRASDLKGPEAAKLRARLRAKGMSVDTVGYLCLQVLPMGWLSAVGIMQIIHRNLLGTRLTSDASLPGQNEVRKTAVMPASKSQRTIST